MKNLIVLSILIALIVFGCSKNDEVKLEKGTPAYDFAKELSSKLPSLDPDKNNVFVSTKEFNVTTGEVIQNIINNSGNRSSQLHNMNADRLKRIIEQTAQGLAEQKLMLTAAKNYNITVSPTQVDSMLNLQYNRIGGKEKFLEWLTNNGISIENVKNDIQNYLIINRYLDKTIASKIQVSEEEIQKAYNGDKTASVRHILLMTQGKSDSAKQEIRKKMEGILAQAKIGEDFAELAKKYTEDPGSKNNGGLYENFGRGQMVKPFEDAAFSVPIGEISDVIETQYGYHILKVIDRKKETRPLEEVRPELEEKFKESKKNELYQTHLAKLKKDASFEMMQF